MPDRRFGAGMSAHIPQDDLTPDEGRRAAVRHLALTASHGFPLAARHYRADQAKATIVLASATGVPQDFYSRFCVYAAARGYDVVTVDYRGIGGSAPATLKGFRVDYRDWTLLLRWRSLRILTARCTWWATLSEVRRWDSCRTRGRWRHYTPSLPARVGPDGCLRSSGCA
jgi:pimeloyl-ACP methyl ester carboxylesterase